MKKTTILILLFALMAAMSSCTTTIPVISVNAYKSVQDDIKSEMAEMGYSLSGEKSEQKNEVSVSGVSYSRWTGYGSALKNNYWNYSEFSFVDSANNNVSYTLKYKEYFDHGEKCIMETTLTGCNANKKYDEICGTNGLVKKKIGAMTDNPDKYIRVTDQAGTVVTVVGVTLGLSILTTILILLL